MKLRIADIFPDRSKPGLVFRQPTSFLQTPFWAEFKAEHGWKPLYFILGEEEEEEEEEESDIFLTVLVRRFTRFASIAYVPMGPDFACENPDSQAKYLEALSKKLSTYVPSNTFCIRYDPPWGTAMRNNTSVDTALPTERDTDTFPCIPAKPVRIAPVQIQPPDTVILDLLKPSDILLSEMKSKWRYNIKLAEKKGVVIRCYEGEQTALEGISFFYNLYLETAKRDGIAIHSKNYYLDLAKKAARNSSTSPYDKTISLRIYCAQHENTPLASIITLFCGEEAVYLYGASSNEKRNLMPAYALQWKAIMDAQKAGCQKYDFYGIPPTDDPTHPMHGLYRFKTGFGGTIIHRVGSLDIPLRPIVYRLYRLLEGIRSLWYKKLVKLVRRETPRKS